MDFMNDDGWLLPNPFLLAPPVEDMNALLIIVPYDFYAQLTCMAGLPMEVGRSCVNS